MHAPRALVVALLALPSLAAEPPCSQCVDTPAVYDDAHHVSYVLINSGRSDGNCDRDSSPGWTLVEARAQQAFGPAAHLVSIDNAIQHAFILDNVMSKPEIQLFAWIGLRSNSSCNSFFWSDGSPVNFSVFCEANRCADTGCSGSLPNYGVIQKNADCWKMTINWRQCCSGFPIHGIVEIPCPDAIASEPAPACYPEGGKVSFTASLTAPAPSYSRNATFQWHRNGEPLVNGPQPGGSTVFGARCANTVASQCQLFIVDPSADDSGIYDCRVTTTCRPEAFTTTPAAIIFGRACPPDINCDALLNSQDFFDFLTHFFAGDPAADYNTDAVINSQDFFDFLEDFFEGCP